MMLAVGLLLVAWVCLGFWVRARLRAFAGAAPVPTWFRTAVIIGGVVYLLLVLLGSVGCSRPPEVSRSGPRDLLRQTPADALQAMMVLTSLRAGHLTNALELLEMQLGKH